MSENPDLDELARKYLDLWQQHMGALAKDGETAEVLANTIALMNSGAAAFAESMADAMRPTGGSRDEDAAVDGSGKNIAGGETGSGAPDGAATPAASHGDAGAVVDELLERITALEERVARLERQGTRPSRSKPKT